MFTSNCLDPAPAAITVDTCYSEGIQLVVLCKIIGNSRYIVVVLQLYCDIRNFHIWKIEVVKWHIIVLTLNSISMAMKHVEHVS